ncbi:scavenger receptor cysteine-rich type 1 protein M130-like isoform X2 [Rhinatrema bivittatum]|uniref:scavenger receptor cysteine-rich type 1 protein M130-like isoform X2 n=1 Tax=Rhinatrema bivittatum TaxID=194408 RepID=UPI00112E46CB|nr:scavenger receptor cysteine-rich type 1 protein M130-like isoform X2 [Rhinatrema bivittatum]
MLTCGAPCLHTCTTMPSRKERYYLVLALSFSFFLSQACGKKVRLVNGDHLCSGRVEVQHNDKWWQVCDDNWDDKDARVVCQQLSCGVSAKAFSMAYYGESSGNYILDRVNCSGSEASLLDCPSRGLETHTCQPGEEAGVNCTEPIQVRLADGGSACAGRVELFLDGTWSPVCDSSWDLQGAKVVCGQLKCGSATAAQGSPFFGLGTAPVRSVRCRGNETMLPQCTLSKTVQSGCTRARAICSEHKELRLKDSPRACTGTILIKEGSKFSSICREYWTLKDALVACRQLGCGEAVSTGQVAVNANDNIWDFQPHCVGNESSLWQCPTVPMKDKICADNLVARIECSGNISVRLVNGTDRCLGTLEVMEVGSWGTVCARGWNLADADVVCRELGCGKAAFQPDKGHLPFSSQQMAISDVDCGGQEQFLWQCGFNRHTQACSDGQVQVVCQDSLRVRLVGGDSRCAGRLEVRYQGTWGTVCTSHEPTNLGEVVCQELNCEGESTTRKNTFYGSGTGKIWLRIMQCDKPFTSLWQCKKSFSTGSCQHSADISVTCKGHKELRLKGEPCSGLLEIKRIDQNIWSPVSVTYSNGTASIASVACRQMQCGHATNYTSQMVDNKPVFAIDCQGSEENVWSCNIQDLSEEESIDISSSEEEDEESTPDTTLAPVTEFAVRHQVISVNCSEHISLRLQSGGHRCSGMVEVYYKGEWRAVCSRGWNIVAAELTCRELGCGKVVSHARTNDLPKVSGRAWLDSLNCRDDAQFLWHCSTQLREEAACSGNSGAVVACSDSLDLKLVGGQSRCSGTLEVFYRYQWRKVCSSSWRQEDYARLCQRLDCGNISSPASGEKLAPGTTWLSVSCKKANTFFLECAGTDWKEESCNQKAVAVICSEHKELRLKGSKSPCSGRVEIHHKDQWKVLSGEGWDRRDADVACRQLHCGTALNFSSDGEYFGSHGPWEEEFHCAGNESRLWDCRTTPKEVVDTTTRRDAATVHCSGESRIEPDPPSRSYDDVDNVPMNDEDMDSEVYKGSKEADTAASEQLVLPSEEIVTPPGGDPKNAGEESHTNLEAILLET